MSAARGDKQEVEAARERSAMVRHQLAARGIYDPRVLRVMGQVPRERFVGEDMHYAAYEDRALPVSAGQTISQPYIVAYMTEELDLKPDHRVLEIGTGTGYQTAVLAALCRHVYTIERLESLSTEAKQRLADLQVANVSFLVGDGTLGWIEHAPFDRIMVTAGAPSVPEPLVAQLVEGGKLIIPIGHEYEQRLVRVERHKGKTVEIPLIAVRFVKLVGRAGWQSDE